MQIHLSKPLALNALKCFVDWCVDVLEVRHRFVEVDD
jgi:hypothetical protein